MKVPNAHNAVIDHIKLVDYLLNPEHIYGGSKARWLFSLGYSVENWQQLEADLRIALSTSEVASSEQTSWGLRYEIVSVLKTPSQRQAICRSIWQIDVGTDTPRLITMYPE